MKKFNQALRVTILAFFIIPMFVICCAPTWLLLDWVFEKDYFIVTFRGLCVPIEEFLKNE